MHRVSYLVRGGLVALAVLVVVAIVLTPTPTVRAADDVKTDVPFVPTPQDVVEKMLEVAKVDKKDVVWDLGCGDGRIPVTAAKKFGCKAMGFDIDPKRIEESNENVKKSKVDDLVKIEKKNIFELDLSKEPTVITMYLLPSVNEKLIPQLQKCKDGTRIVSHSFEMGKIKPKDTFKIKSKETDREHTIYLWVTPLKEEK